MQNSQVKAGKMKTSRQNKAYYRALEDNTEKTGLSSCYAKIPVELFII